MKMMLSWAVLGCATFATAAEPFLFRDDQQGLMQDGWRWIREDRESWRFTDKRLEIRVLPGNMWGAANNARNVLVRPVLVPDDGAVEISVNVENHPTEQYEQVDLVWYYADSHMVKIGQELVDGKLSVVMGREEKDRTRTLAIIPLRTQRVGLRFKVEGNTIQGFFRPEGAKKWRKAGDCDLPRQKNARPHLSLQAYQGPKDDVHWARITDLHVSRVAP